MSDHNSSEGGYAGIWTRLAAHVIDWTIVSAALFPFMIVIHTLAPSLVEVKVPFDAFVVKERISASADGNEVIERESFLGVIENNYLTTKSINEKGRQEKKRELIDPESKVVLKKIRSSRIEALAIFLYWILLEASAWQASIGKRLMSIKVVDLNGQRLTLARSAARNLSKILSVFTFGIGFLMIGLTRREQGLHDILARALVVRGRCNQG
jgi:uncharacterized RDD family membrane protein YckC